MESYDKQLHISNIKCHLTKYGAFRSLFWDKMYTLFGSAPKSALRSQRVKGIDKPVHWVVMVTLSNQLQLLSPLRAVNKGR